MSKIILFLICSAVTASAGLSKLDALAMIETGNNDAVVGSAGEVSRYQIKPRIWREYSPSRAFRDVEVSTVVAKDYLTDLESQFRKRAGREATDFDLYVLWNAGPAYYARINFSARRVGSVIRERANRYVNLRQMRNNPPVLAVAKATPAPAPTPALATPVPAPAPAPAPALTAPAAPSRPRLDAPLPQMQTAALQIAVPHSSLLALGGNISAR